MDQDRKAHCTAFEGVRCIASGELKDVALKTKAVIDRGEHAAILIFDDLTGHPIDLDFRGTVEDLLGKLARKATPAISEAESEGQTRRGPGRPKLGVVAREV